MEVSSLESHKLFNSLEKLHDAHCKLVSISCRILDGSRSDELCNLLDTAFRRFRNMECIVEKVVDSECNQIQTQKSAANDAFSPVTNNVIDFNKMVSALATQYDAVKCSNAMLFSNLSNMPPSPDFSNLTVVERAKRLLHATEIIEYVKNQSR